MQSDIVQRLQEIRAFLDGSGELNGLSFGDRTVHPATGKPVLFWWRRELTALDEAAAEITRLTEALRAAEEREKALREANHNLRDGYADAVSGYRYILAQHGRLEGVGFDRVMYHYHEWVAMPEREGLLAGSHAITGAKP